MATLEPLGGSSAARSFAYWGERADWLVALGHHRDSDTLERSNWDVITDDLLTRFADGGDGGPGLEGADIATESFSNWAVGWNEVLLVRPGTPAATAAQEWADRLDHYPVADDDHYSMLEFNEEWCIRCDRGTREQHASGLIKRCGFRSESERDNIDWMWDQRKKRS